MSVSPTPLARVTLLLTSKLKPAAEATPPLSRSEFQQLASWLETRGTPMDGLLAGAAARLLRGHPGAERIQQLLRREAGVERLLESWRRLGIWVLSERDPPFPARLRQRLGNACLPLLFGTGDPRAVGQGGLCVVGSRDCAADSLDFARLIGARAARDGMLVISSDMRGVDREVVMAALAAGGRVTCVLSEGLEKTAMSRRYREALGAGRLALVSPFLPSSHFAVANAMRAHSYQYGLADAAIVVETRQTGGVWSGAEQNRKHQWVPAFVRADANAPRANTALLHLGLLPLTRADVDRSASLAQLLIARTRPGTPAPPGGAADLRPAAGPDFYALFMAEFARLEAADRCCEEAVARRFAIEPAQAGAWLARARQEGLGVGPLAPRCGAHRLGDYNEKGTYTPC